MGNKNKNKIAKILASLLLIAIILVAFLYVSNNTEKKEDTENAKISSSEGQFREPVLSTERIEGVIRKTIEEYQEELDKIDSMKMKENYLFGRIMRQLKGRADHKHVREILIEVLEEVYTN